MKHNWLQKLADILVETICMKKKRLEQLSQLLVEGDLTQQYTALRELAKYKDESTIPALEKVLFSEELKNTQAQLERDAKDKTDAREITAMAYLSYEIEILRYEIVALLEKIGTEEALEIVRQWEKAESNAD